MNAQKKIPIGAASGFRLPALSCGIGTTDKSLPTPQTLRWNPAGNPTAKQCAKLQTPDEFHPTRNIRQRSTVPPKPTSISSQRGRRELRETAAGRKQNTP